MNRLTERLSSLTPLLQGKQVNYLPMMVGALKHQAIEDDMIQSTLEKCIRTMPVGDLGEKLYPKNTFDEYYIHKTNYYLGQLKKRSFETIFSDLIEGKHDFGVTFEFAGFLRLIYALRTEDELLTAEALAFLDLSLIKKSKFDEVDGCTYDKYLSEALDAYHLAHNRVSLIQITTLLAIKELEKYIPSFDETVTKIVSLFQQLPNNNYIATYPTIEHIKKHPITHFEDPLSIVFKDMIIM